MTNPIRDYWMEHKDKDFCICPALQCADGFIMSVQASRMHYCQPREDMEDGDYSHWEIGFPSHPEIHLRCYYRGGDPTQSIYEYVPTQVVNDIIAKHGGIAGTAKTQRRRRKRNV